MPGQTVQKPRRRIKRSPTHVAFTPITERTSILPGGHGRTFLYRLGGSNKVIIIDPGVTQDFMSTYYFIPIYQRVLSLIPASVRTSQKLERGFLRNPANRIHVMGQALPSDADVVLLPELLNSFTERSESIKEFIGQNGLELVAIVVTHSHVDHLGCAHHLSELFGFSVPIFLPDPKFYKRLDSTASKTISSLLAPSAHLYYSDFRSDDFPKGIDYLDLSGHAEVMVGIELPDGCFIAGDLLLSVSGLNNGAVLYLEDYARHMRSLMMMLGIYDSKLLLLSHGGPDTGFDLDAAKALVRSNVKSVARTKASLDKNDGDILATAEQLTRINDPNVPLEDLHMSLAKAVGAAHALRGYV